MKLSPPLLENFRYQNSFETQVFSYEFYRHCETKNFQRSLVKNSTERFAPMKFFGTETKVFDGKSWYSPPSSYPYTFSLPEIFWIRAQKGYPMKFFGTVWQKFSTEKRDTPLPLMHKILRYTKFSETPNCSPTNLFGTVGQKFSTEKRDTPSLWCIKFCDTQKFLKQRTVPQRIFLVPWDKSFRRRNVIPPSLFLWCIKFFDTQNFPLNRSVPQRIFSVLWDNKFWTRSRDTPYFA